MKLILTFLALTRVSCTNIDPRRPDEGAEWSDTRLNPIALIKKYQYPAELHQVTTQDGYILSLHRIPYGRMCPRHLRKGSVILQHGLVSSSVHWILPGTKRGLGYILADSCYDVWLANARGNSFSLSHVNYSINSYRFWDFTWHEMGVYDLPAMFDYVLDETGAEDVTYVAHSQGSTAFFVFNIFHPEYARKVKAAFMLAPVAYMSNIRSGILRLVARFHRPLKVAADRLRIYDVAEQNDLFNNIVELFCPSLRPINPVICENLIFMITGYDPAQINSTLLLILSEAGLYGLGIKQVVHYGQLVESGRFRQYDYGGRRNLQVYNRKSPPDYDLSKVAVPVHLYNGRNDYLATPEDVSRLMAELPNVRESYLVKYDRFNHMDHLFATDIIDLEYDHLVGQIDGYHA